MFSEDLLPLNMPINPALCMVCFCEGSKKSFYAAANSQIYCSCNVCHAHCPCSLSLCALISRGGTIFMKVPMQQFKNIAFYDFLYPRCTVNVQDLFLTCKLSFAALQTDWE